MPIRIRLTFVLFVLVTNLAVAQIENVRGRSNSEKDLQLLNRISVTDYTLIDTANKGNGVTKKVIARELEQVYPTAVTKTTGVIPNIYALAEINGGVVKVNNDLKKGEKVQLIFGERKELFEVLEADDTSFKVNSKEKGKVFVFGKQVNDFRTVDYEALSILAISAIQQLSKENEALKKSLERMADDTEEMEESFNELKFYVNELRKLVDAKLGDGKKK